MKSRDLIEALLAVLGIKYIVDSLGFLLGFAFTRDAEGAFPTLFVMSIPVAIGIGLIEARASLADRLSARAVDGDSTGPGPRELLETALAVLGVYLVARAISDGASLIAHEWIIADSLRSLPDQAARPLEEVWPRRIQVLVVLVLGVVLAIGRRGVAWSIRAVRNAGRSAV